MSVTTQPAQLQVLAPLPLPGVKGAGRPANAGRSLWDEPQPSTRATHGMTRAKRVSLVLGAVAVVATGIGVSA